MADSDADARRERLRQARASLGTPSKPKGLRHPDVEGDDPLGTGAAGEAGPQAPGGGLRGRLGQGGGLRGQGGGLRGGQRGGQRGGLRGGQGGGLRGQGGGLAGGGLRGLRGQGGAGLGGGLRGQLGQGGGALGGGNGAADGDPAAQRAFLQDRLEKLQAKLAELDNGVEDATIVDEEPGPARKG